MAYSRQTLQEQTKAPFCNAACHQLAKESMTNKHKSEIHMKRDYENLIGYSTNEIRSLVSDAHDPLRPISCLKRHDSLP